MKTDDSDFLPYVESLLQQHGLNRDIRIYSWLSASVALCSGSLIRSFIDLAIAEHIAVIKIKEIILQNYLFCGFPNAIEGLIELRRALHDYNLGDENFEELRDPESIYQDGLDLCRQVYGKNYDKLIINMAHLSSDLAGWMITEGYGKVLSRPVLTPRERELSIIASLAVLRRERQLISHIRGAAHVGAQRDEIIAVLSGLSVITAKETVEVSIKIVNETLN